MINVFIDTNVFLDFYLEAVQRLEEEVRQYATFISSPEFRRNFNKFQKQMEYIRKHPDIFKF